MLPFFKKMAYGVGRFGSTFILTLTDLTTFYIYGAFFQLSWILSGAALSASFVVIGLTHWLTGYYSDQVDTQIGRRKPFVVIGAPGLAISAFMLFIPNWFLNTADPASELMVFGYYLAFICLTKFFYAFLLTAYQAWMPEITEEDERPLVSSMQNTANWVATGGGIALGFVAPFLFIAGPPPGLSDVGLSVLLAFCAIAVIFFIPSAIWIRERPDIVIPERSLREETKTVLRNRVYFGWMITVSFLSFTITAIVAQVIGFAQQVLLLNTIPLLAIPALALVVAIMAFLFLWIKLLKRMGKGRALRLAMIVLGILLLAVPGIAALTNFISNVVVGVVFFVPLAACIAVYYLLSYVVPADIAQVDELRTGESRAGMYEGFKGVPYNFAQAISALLLGVVMQYSLMATGSNVFGLTWWAPIYAPFLFIAALILRYINIDPDFDMLKLSAAPKKKRAPRKKKKSGRKKKEEKAAPTVK